MVISTCPIYTVKLPHCVFLWSSSAKISAETKASQQEIRDKLLSKNIRIEQVDAISARTRGYKHELLGISGKRGKYPQVFIKDENNQIKFIGLNTDINV